MTVSVEVVKVGPIEGNGVTTAFPFNFKTFAEADVVVTHTDQYGVETTLVLDADYSVALNPDQNAAPGGTVTYPIVVGIPPVYLPPMTAGNFLTLENGVDFTQPTDLITGGQYQPQTVEEMGDRMTLLATRLHAMWLSSFRLSPGDTLGGSAILPNSSVRANRVLGFDASGNLETKFTLGALTDADVAAIIESYTMAMVNKTFDDFSNTIHADALHLQVRNSSGSLIPKGSVVYTTGATGSLPTIDLADASTEATSSTTLGIVTADIANNGIGQIITKGFVTGMDTSGFTEGVVVWLSPTAGQFTETKPVSPDHLTMVGLIIKAHPTDGYMYIGIINYNELGELHDVLITSIGDKELLQWDSATSLYINRTRAEAGVAARGDLSLALTGGTRVLTAAEFECSSIDVTGALVSAQIIQVPDGVPQIFVVDNGTSGAYTLTVKHSATAGVIIPQGSKYLIYTNGAQVEAIGVATASSYVPVVPYSANYTTVASDIGRLFDYTGTYTLTLLAPATAGNGYTIGCRNSGQGVITVTDGTLTVYVHPNETVWVVCDGGAYKVNSQVALPVDLSAFTTADCKLAVGQMGYVNFSAATSIPLNVATATDEVYELELFIDWSGMATSSGTAYLNPNNTTYASALSALYHYGNSGGGQASTLSTVSAFNLVVPGAGNLYGCKFTVSTRTASKQLFAQSRSLGLSWQYVDNISVLWLDYTTAWSSLGTIALPVSRDGTVTVRRIR